MNRIRTLGALLLAALALPAALHAQPGRDGERPRGWLGISFQLENDNGTETVRVATVAPGSPAQRAFVRDGDVVLRVDGAAASEASVERMRTRLFVGDTVRLVIREPDGDEENRVVVAAARPATFSVRTPGRVLAPGQNLERIVIRTDTIRQGLDSLIMRMDSLRTQIRILRPGHEGGGMVRIDGDSTVIIHLDTAFMHGFENDSTWRHFREDVERNFGPEFQRRFENEFGPDGVRLRVWSDSVLRGLSIVGPEMQESLRELSALGEMTEMPFLMDFGMRGLAGAEFAELNEGLGRYFRRDRGLLVLKVGPDSPAARAGLEPGDVVVQAGGEPVVDVAELRRATSRAENGRLPLEVVRDGRSRRVELEWESQNRVFRYQMTRPPRN